MTQVQNTDAPALLLMVAGAKGAIGTTLALATTAMRDNNSAIINGLTTRDKFPFMGDVHKIQMVGWDSGTLSMAQAAQHHAVVPESLRSTYTAAIEDMDVRPAPAMHLPVADQVKHISHDMRHFINQYPQAHPVFVSLLPAAQNIDQVRPLDSLDAILRLPSIELPDMGYALAALTMGIPIVNFTPNTIEFPVICQEALTRQVPLAGRDGKTGQTYFKVVLASALKARALYVDGWYSLNILGNEDGKNLMDPERACGKLDNKTNLLDDILEYKVGERYKTPTHKVHIDYYPPRGDAKEAWDVIDLQGIFGLPMSLRLNLQARDSILAAPLAIDMARWTAALKRAGIGGPIADLGFFFKKPVGNTPPITFQEQLTALERLEKQIADRI